MNRRALVLFALMSVIWGIPYLFIRVAVDEITPATLVFFRTSIGAAILLPLALARTDIRAVLAHWRWIGAFAVVEVAIPWVLLGSAEQHVTSSLAALLVAGVPLVGTVVALTTGSRHRVGPTGALGLLLGMTGVAAIVGFDIEGTDPSALVEIAVVVVGYAVGPAILSRRLASVPSVAIMALSLTMCALLYAPVAVLQWPNAVPSFNAIAAIVTLGTVCTAAAFIVFAALIGAVGPVRSTVITYINPAVAALLGVAVLNEPITVPMLAGFGLVLAGSALATRAPAEPMAEVAPA